MTGRDLAATSAAELARAGRIWRDLSPAAVVVIAVDGPGGAGKSTIAAAAADLLGASLLHTDDFFRPASPNLAAAPPPSPSPAPLALAGYYEWRRLRDQALMPLRSGRPARYHRYDWSSGRLEQEQAETPPSPLVVLEGVMASAPQLADLVDHAVLVDTPEPQRLARLRARIAPQDWDEQWLAAEQAYFTRIRAPGAFELIVAGGVAGGEPTTQSDPPAPLP